jgi:hypothetical protein
MLRPEAEKHIQGLGEQELAEYIRAGTEFYQPEAIDFAMAEFRRRYPSSQRIDELEAAVRGGDVSPEAIPAAKPHDDINDDDAVPLCPRCLRPHSPLLHYCPNCGCTVGQFTPNIPFMNIPYQIDFWSVLWRRIWASDTHPALRVMYIVLVLLCVPILLLGLPFLLLKGGRAEPRGFDVLVDTETKLAVDPATKGAAESRPLDVGPDTQSGRG